MCTIRTMTPRLLRALLALGIFLGGGVGLAACGAADQPPQQQQVQDDDDDD